MSMVSSHSKSTHWSVRLAMVAPLAGLWIFLIWYLPSNAVKHYFWVGTAGWIAAAACICVYWRMVCQPSAERWGYIVRRFVIWVLLVINATSFGVGYDSLNEADSPLWVLREFFRWGGLLSLALCVPLSGKLFLLLFEAIEGVGPPVLPQKEESCVAPPVRTPSYRLPESRVPRFANSHIPRSHEVLLRSSMQYHEMVSGFNGG